MLRVIVLIMLMAPGAAAQKIIEWWDGSYQEAFREARKRNVPLLIAFIQDDEEANDRIVSGLYRDPVFIKLTRACIPLVACIDEHDTQKQTIRGHTRSCCNRFGAISCSRHREVDRYARPRYWADKAVKTPSHVVVRPDGKEVGRIIDVEGTASYVGLVKKAQKRLGRGITDQKYRKLKDGLRGADYALRQGKIKEAIAYLQVAEKFARKHPLEKQVEAAWARVNQEGAALLEQAAELQEQKDAVGALRALKLGAEAYKGARVRRQIKNTWNEFRRTKAGRQAERVLAREDRARPELEKAVKAEKGGDWVKAALSYERVMVRAKDTPLAEQARKRLEVLKKDPDIGKLIADAARAKEALRAYRAALALIRSGRREEARKALKLIVERYPKTSAARKAKAELEKTG